MIGNTCVGNGVGSRVGAGIHIQNINNSIENNLLTDNDWGLLITSSGNFFTSNRASGNYVSNYSTWAENTDGGTINSNMTNVNFHNIPNLMIQYFPGFDIPLLHKTSDVVIHNLKW